MDLSVLIPIVAVAIGVPGFVAFVAVIAGHTRKMKELAIRDRELESPVGDGAWEAIDALRNDLGEARAEVAEMQERLDFTERLLSTREPARKIAEVDSARAEP